MTAAKFPSPTPDSPSRPSRPSRWKAGALAAAAASLLALSLAAPGHAAEAFSATRVATANHAASVIAKHGPGLAPLPAAAGDAMATTLGSYAGLPPATIILARMGNDNPLEEGSRAIGELGKDGKYSCNVLIVVDQAGKATLARGMAFTMGLDPGEALQARLAEFETLHEIGHCSALAGELEFSHPELSTALNKNIDRAMTASEPMHSLWSESYADAYAALHILSGAQERSPEDYARALSDIALARDYRISERRLISGDGDTFDPADTRFIIQDGHLDEHCLSGLLAAPERWLSDPRPIEAKASDLASLGTVQAFTQSPTSDEIAHAMFTADGFSSNLIEQLATQLSQQAADSKYSGSPKSKNAFMREALSESANSDGDAPKKISALDAKLEQAIDPLLPKIAEASWSAAHAPGPKRTHPQFAYLDAIASLQKSGVMAQAAAAMTANGSGSTLSAAGHEFMKLSKAAKNNPTPVPIGAIAIEKTARERDAAGEATLNSMFYDIAEASKSIQQKLANRAAAQTPELHDKAASAPTLPTLSR